ncbi:MAG: T9SS type A sorting domain-containing protein [Vicingaceae bacterium]
MAINGFAQNLVPNPSFEDTLSCPTGLGNFTVVDWVNPTTASPDYFHSCNTGNIGVPLNGFGWQNARTGNGYVGGHTSDFGATDYREYVQCQLDSILKAGRMYEVSFYVSRTDSSKKACDNIGAYLSTTAITSGSNQNLSVTPQVVSQPNNHIVDDVNWVQIIDTITAIGGEEYLTLGVFSNNANTNWITVSGGWEDEAHYYYDDVSVVEVFPTSINEFSQVNISIFPNPSNGNIKISSNEAIENYTVHTSLGQIIFSKEIITNTHQQNVSLTNYTSGVYYINIKTTNSPIIKKLIIH